jgi:hypothetical protein
VADRTVWVVERRVGDGQWRTRKLLQTEKAAVISLRRLERLSRKAKHLYVVEEELWRVVRYTPEGESRG